MNQMFKKMYTMTNTWNFPWRLFQNSILRHSKGLRWCDLGFTIPERWPYWTTHKGCKMTTEPHSR